MTGSAFMHARIQAGRFLAHGFTGRGRPGSRSTGVRKCSSSGLCPAVRNSIWYCFCQKHGYVGRTFIKPKQSSRESSVRVKLNVLEEAVRGKRIIMIDDSIVRGTTSDRIVNMLKEAGATEVHVRISSPPFLWPCYFGTDIPAREQLIAYNQNHRRYPEDNRCRFSWDILEIERLEQLVGGLPICKGCFTGKYPMEPPKEDIRGDYER